MTKTMKHKWVSKIR